MMKVEISRYVWFFVLLWLGVTNYAFSQEASIELGKRSISLNEIYTLTLTLKNDNIKNYSNFPDVPGFNKRGVSSSTSTSIINGKTSIIQSITQNYVARKEGTYKIAAFKMTVNEATVSSEGGSVAVGPAVQQRNSSDPMAQDLFEEFFGNKVKKEFVDVKDDAFFALTSNKESIYVGEGFTVSLAFYISDDNLAEMDWYQLGSQLVAISKKIAQPNCWVEDFNISEIQTKPVLVNRKRYTEYKFYEAVYYPINNKPIVFPEVGLKVVKYKVAKEPGFFGLDRKQDFKVFNSKPMTIQPKELPPHPLRDQVAVGNFRLNEDLRARNQVTGESFTYGFRIMGEGNITAISMPEIPRNTKFDIYPPNVNQDIARSNGRVTGMKSFYYQIIPREPGDYLLKPYFSWVFFNPQKARYDTLSARSSIKIKGESLRNLDISSNDLGPLYNSIDKQSNTLHTLNRYDWVRTAVNIVILLMILVTAGVILKR